MILMATYFTYATFGDSADFELILMVLPFRTLLLQAQLISLVLSLKAFILDETDFKEMRVRWNSLEDSLSQSEFS